jgi:hypothetical protein
MDKILTSSSDNTFLITKILVGIYTYLAIILSGLKLINADGSFSFPFILLNGLTKINSYNYMLIHSSSIN